MTVFTQPFLAARVVWRINKDDTLRELSNGAQIAVLHKIDQQLDEVAQRIRRNQ